LIIQFCKKQELARFLFACGDNYYWEIMFPTCIVYYIKLIDLGVNE